MARSWPNLAFPLKDIIGVATVRGPTGPCVIKPLEMLQLRHCLEVRCVTRDSARVRVYVYNTA